MIRFGNFASAVETRQFDTDAAAYFAAMSVQPADARKELINDLVIGVKDAGLWFKIDWFLLLAAHDAQAGRVNLRNPAKVATAVNSPIFTVDRGFLGDNATTYISFGESYAASGNVFSQDDAFIASYVNTNNSNKIIMGQQVVVGSAPTVLHNISFGGNEFVALNNTGTSSYPNMVSRVGLRLLTRTGPTAGSVYKDGVETLGTLPTSSSPPDKDARLLMGASSTSSASFSGDRLAFAASGSGLSATEAADLRTLTMTYLTAIGAN